MNINGFNRDSYLKEFESYISSIILPLEGKVGEAMRYAVADGGKRIRPLCVYFGALAVGGNVDIRDILPIAAAVELVHSYSLVHDDMPEMDDDDMRRGKPSVHKRFGVATALLAGDGLLTLASVEALKSQSSAAKEIMVGALDMVYGQSAEFEGCDTLEDWLKAYSGKTAALIKGAFRAGAICAGASDKDLDTVTQLANSVGMAFQLSDDLLDDDPSVASLIGKDSTRVLLAEYSKRAKACADKLKYSKEIAAFITELWQRKS